MVHIVNIIEKIPLFEGLQKSDYEKISSVVKKIKIPANTLLFEEGDHGEAFYLLESGTVDVYKGLGEAQKRVNSISDDDESNFFGEMALIENAPRNATIKTKTNCELLEIDKTNFEMLLRLNSFISLRIMSALTRRFRDQTNKNDTKAQTPETPQKSGQIITLFSPKGGAGKSVLAANLASGIAKCTDKKVLLIDLDLQFGDLAFMLGLKPAKTIGDIIEHDLSSEDVLKEHIIEHKSGFHVMSCPLKPEQSETVTSNHVRDICKKAVKIFDLIILDTHSLFNDLSINMMDISDEIYLMIKPEMNQIKGMKTCVKVMEGLKYAPDKLRLVLSREECEYAQPRDDIESYFGKKFDLVFCDDYKQASNLVNNKTTVFDTDASSKYKNQVIIMIEKLLGEKIDNKFKSGGITDKIKSWFSK